MENKMTMNKQKHENCIKVQIIGPKVNGLQIQIKYMDMEQDCSLMDNSTKGTGGMTGDMVREGVYINLVIITVETGRTEIGMERDRRNGQMEMRMRETGEMVNEQVKECSHGQMDTVTVETG